MTDNYRGLCVVEIDDCATARRMAQKYGVAEVLSDTADMASDAAGDTPFTAYATRHEQNRTVAFVLCCDGRHLPRRWSAISAVANGVETAAAVCEALVKLKAYNGDTEDL